MFILQLFAAQNRGTGDFVYRISDPAQGLNTLPGVEVHNLDLLQVQDWQLLLEAPLLILHHLSDPDLLPIVRQRKARGLPTVYELADNFRASHLHLPSSRRTGPPERHYFMQALLKRCDAVQTTSLALQERYGHFNPTFFVYPNLIKEEVLRERRKQDDTFTIGWGGSSRHFDDIKSHAKTLCRWVAGHDNVRLAIMGVPRIHELFAELPAHKLTLKAPGDLQDYFAFIDSLDVGLALLQPSEFNACRSDVKFLEYASRRVVPVCSAYGPYLELRQAFSDILLFDTKPELVGLLDRLYEDHSWQQEQARKANRFVREQRRFSKHDWQARLRNFESLFQNQTGRNANDNLRAHLAQSKSDDLLAQTVKDGLEAPDSQALAQVAVQQPENYQAQYFHAAALMQSGQPEKAIASLQKALKLQPESARTIQLLARAYILTGEARKAGEVIEKGLEIEPGLATLLSMQALLLMAKGQWRAAETILEQCEIEASELMEPNLALAQLYLRLGSDTKARTLLQKLKMLAPESSIVAKMQNWLDQKQSHHRSGHPGNRFAAEG